MKRIFLLVKILIFLTFLLIAINHTKKILHIDVKEKKYFDIKLEKFSRLTENRVVGLRNIFFAKKKILENQKIEKKIETVNIGRNIRLVGIINLKGERTALFKTYVAGAEVHNSKILQLTTGMEIFDLKVVDISEKSVSTVDKEGRIIEFNIFKAKN